MSRPPVPDAASRFATQARTATDLVLGTVPDAGVHRTARQSHGRGGAARGGCCPGGGRSRSGAGFGLQAADGGGVGGQSGPASPPLAAGAIYERELVQLVEPLGGVLEAFQRRSRRTQAMADGWRWG